jgi:hypothetical protein
VTNVVPGSGFSVRAVAKGATGETEDAIRTENPGTSRSGAP